MLFGIADIVAPFKLLQATVISGTCVVSVSGARKGVYICLEKRQKANIIVISHDSALRHSAATDAMATCGQNHHVRSACLFAVTISHAVRFEPMDSSRCKSRKRYVVHYWPLAAQRARRSFVVLPVVAVTQCIRQCFFKSFSNRVDYMSILC